MTLYMIPSLEPAVISEITIGDTLQCFCVPCWNVVRTNQMHERHKLVETGYSG